MATTNFVSGTTTIDADWLNDVDAVAYGDYTGGLKTKIVAIGDWDMDADAQHQVVHGLTLANIRGAQATIRHDNGTVMADLMFDSTGTGTWGITWDATIVTLYRRNSGDFDNTGYDTPLDGNRGWLIIQYLF